MKRRIKILVIAAVMLLLSACGRNAEQEKEAQRDNENSKAEKVSEMSHKVVYETSPAYVKNAVDHLIENGEINPVIIVTPTFYPKGDNDASVSNAGVLTEKFPTEFINDLMPAVEEAYHTYAESVSQEGLKASRGHRAFGGFSMGSVTTWYMFADALDYVSTFIPESGDCWIVEQMGGANATEETVEKLKEAVINRGFDSSDFTIYAATGTEDIAYSQMNAQIEKMKTESEVFKFSSIKGEGNLYYNLAEGKTHDYGPARDYFYDALKFLYGTDAQ